MKKNSNIKIMISALLLSAIAFTSCSKSDSKAAFTNNMVQNESAGYSNAEYTEDYCSDEALYDYEKSFDSVNTVEAAENNSVKTNLPDKQNTADETISKEMLVYRCKMEIDVLEYEQSINDYKELINKYKGFVENENYNDGAGNSKWIYENTQKFSTYTATVRIPSSDYDNFCKELEQIGDLRRKSASVDNLSQEYSDLNTTLSIYEAKEKRYIDLLSTIKEEQYAIEVERELTNIETEIAKIKTRMKKIKDDVTYSYVDVTISEVKEYTEKTEPPKTKTFSDRLKNTVQDTFEGFLNFLENLLFFIINVIPYVLVIGLLFFIIKLIIKSLIKKSRIKKEKKAMEKQNSIKNDAVNMKNTTITFDIKESQERKDLSQDNKNN